MSVIRWSVLVAGTTAAALVLPLAPGIAEDLRVRVCRSTGGSCGYRPARVRCEVLARDSGLASGVTPLTEQTGDGGDVVVSKLLDGSAVVRLRSPRPGADLGALAARRLGLPGPAGPRPGDDHGTADELGAVWDFPRHDDADAWLDRYRLAEVPVTTAAAGPQGSGVHRGLGLAARAAGFDDPDAVRDPDGVVLDVATQAARPAGYVEASVPISRSDIAGPTELTLDGTGRATTSGGLPPAGTRGDVVLSLATRLGFEPPRSTDFRAGALTGSTVGFPVGFPGDAKSPHTPVPVAAIYRVRTDAAGRPMTLELTGLAGRHADGRFLAASALSRIRERGESLDAAATWVDDPGEGVRTVQTVVLDLRGDSDRKAFDRVFRTGVGLSTPGAAGARMAVVRAAGRTRAVRADRPAQAAAVRALVARIAKDAVFVRTRVQTSVSTPTTGLAQRTETRMVQGFSQDFAVPTSRLTRMPGCSR